MKVWQASVLRMRKGVGMGELVRRARPGIILSIGVIAIWLSGAGYNEADEPSGLVDSEVVVPILDSTEEQLRAAQAKITYYGEQKAPVLTVAFTTDSSTPVMEDFRKVQRLEYPYGNDRLSIRTFGVTAAEFRRMLASVRLMVSTALEKKDEKGRPLNLLYFTILRHDASDIVGDEFAIAADKAKLFYRALIGAIGNGDENGRRTLEKQMIQALPWKEVLDDLPP
jgi:hypothetical protein